MRKYKCQHAECANVDPVAAPKRRAHVLANHMKMKSFECSADECVTVQGKSKGGRYSTNVKDSIIYHLASIHSIDTSVSSNDFRDMLIMVGFRNSRTKRRNGIRRRGSPTKKLC